MRSLLDQSALVENDDSVGVAKRRESVSDGQGRTATDQHFERLLDTLLGLGVDVAGRFVEHQNFRVIQQRSCNRQSLLFPPRQSRAILSQKRFVAELLSADEIVRTGSLGCL